MPECDLTLSVIMAEGFRETDIGFFPDEVPSAEAVLYEHFHIDSEYVAGQLVKVARPLKASATVQQIRAYSADRFATVRATIEKAASAKSANERTQREHDAAHAKQREALKGLWEDWHECVAKQERLGRIVDTFHDYVKTAGDNVIAASFLSKAFEAGDIAEAAEWFEVAIPLFSGVDVPPPAPANGLQDDISF
jgi:cytochrome c556